MSFAIAAPLLAGLLFLPQAWCLGGAIETAVNGNYAAVGPFLLESTVLVACRSALTWYGEACGNRSSTKIISALRRALFARILAKTPDWSTTRASGALSSAIIDQVGALDAFFARYLPTMTLACVLPLTFSIVTLFVEPVVGALFLLTAPLVPIFMALVGWGAEAANARHQSAFLRLSGLFSDRLRGLTTLKLLGRAEDEVKRVREVGDDLRQRTLGVLKIAFLSSAVLEFFAALGVAGVALYVGLTYLGFLHLRSGTLSLQTGMFCLLMAPEVFLPLRQFAATYHDRAAAKAAVTTLGECFDGLPSLDFTEPPKTVQSRAGPRLAISIVAHELTIAPAAEAPAVIRQATFSVVAGDHLAIMGASGIGKSCLIDALAALRSFSGSIEVDGVALADIPPDVLRGRIAWLGQRPRLFCGTIAENIRFGSPAATLPAIQAAAEEATVMRFACRLPMGLETRIGDGGLGLSGGEAHRVALARVFLRDPDLLLLDEPTAHLDSDTEQAVMDALVRFAAGRTMIVATHSAAVAGRMDRSLRIESGKLLSTPRRKAKERPAARETLA